MRNPSYTTAFKKDVKLAQKRGLNIEALKLVLNLIIEEKQLLDRHKTHKLSGNWINRWDCHIAPDWLLIYKIDGQDVIFERTGTHADLFG